MQANEVVFILCMYEEIEALQNKMCSIVRASILNVFGITRVRTLPIYRGKVLTWMLSLVYFQQQREGHKTMQSVTTIIHKSEPNRFCLKQWNGIEQQH